MIPWPFAPVSAFVDWMTADERMNRLMLKVPSSIGIAALDVGLVEEAKRSGEEGRNNRGKDLERFRGSLGGNGAWCAAFVFYCIEVACKGLDRPLPFKRTHGARRLFMRAVKNGRRIDFKDALPGDLILFDRGDPKRKRDKWKAHIGIVSHVQRSDGDVTLYYLAGNEQRFPSRVRQYPLTKKKARKLIGFARLG